MKNFYIKLLKKLFNNEWEEFIINYEIEINNEMKRKFERQEALEQSIESLGYKLEYKTGFKQQTSNTKPIQFEEIGWSLIKDKERFNK